MPDLHSCKSVPCTYCGFGNEDPPLYPDREKKRAKQATEQRERRKLRERTQIRAGSRTLGLEEEQLQFSNHTAATALGLSLPCSNFSKDQDGPDTPLERGESSTSSWQGFSFRPDQGKWVAEIRPPHPVWMKNAWKIGLGSYPTKEAAARAYDVGIYYTGKFVSVGFNISSPAAFLPLFPDNLSFDKLEHVGAIREFVRKEAQDFVAMNEKAKAPYQQVSSVLEKDADMSLEGIVSPRSSMGSKLPMEDDNGEPLQENYELLTTATPFFSWEWPLRNEAQVSASEEDPWLESFLNSFPDLNQNCMNEEGQFMIPESIHVTLCVILPTMAENELGYG
jgi:hypothetical protein